MARHPGRALAAGVAGAAVLLGLFWGTVFFVVVGALRTSVPARMAVHRAAANPAVVEALGRPLRERWLVTGNLHTRTPRNRAPAHAHLKIRIAGPRGKARIETTAEKRAGRWVLTECTVTFADDGNAVDLLATNEPDPSVAQGPAQ